MKPVCLISLPKSDSFRSGLTFCWHFFFSFVISQLRRPIAAKFCTVLGTVFDFIMPVQNFEGPFPPKNLGAKNMQNLARFRTTSNFDREYLRNRWRYSKSDKCFIDRDFSRVRQKSPVNFGRLIMEISSYPPKSTFSKDHILAPKGCCALKFLHALWGVCRIQQTSSKCIQNTRANAGRLLDVCWIV